MKMLMTPAQLLCQPLMMHEPARLALLDETIRSMVGGPIPSGSMPANAMMVGQPSTPQVEVSYFDVAGQQLVPEANSSEEPTEGAGPTEINTEGRDPGSLIAVVSVSGVLTRHGYSGWWSSRPGTIDIGRTVQKLNRDPAVHTIVLMVNSPGGTVTGTPELAKLIYDIREEANTQIVSVVDDFMASAATYVGTAASRVYSIPSALSGSVGVIIGYTSYHKALEKAGIEFENLRVPEKKARFSGYEPMTDDMRDTLQERIDESYAWFVQDMARNRGVSESHVKKSFGQGEVMRADACIEARLIDEIATIDDVVLMQADDIKRKRQNTRRKAASDRLDAAIKEQESLDEAVSGTSDDSDNESEPENDSELATSET